MTKRACCKVTRFVARLCRPASPRTWARACAEDDIPRALRARPPSCGRRRRSGRRAGAAAQRRIPPARNSHTAGSAALLPPYGSVRRDRPRAGSARSIPIRGCRWMTKRACGKVTRFVARLRRRTSPRRCRADPLPAEGGARLPSSGEATCPPPSERRGEQSERARCARGGWLFARPVNPPGPRRARSIRDASC